jgi:hypothetical protein
MLKMFGKLVLALGCVWLTSTPALAAMAPVAVFPLQELADGRNDANLPFSKVLAERLADNGNNIIGMDTVIAFMANNRIRSVGHLDSLNISRVRRDLGAVFILLGTISQRKEKPEPSFGLTLSLVRTSDVRTVWTYAGGVSRGEERKVLGIGEPQSATALQPLLLDEIVAQWPWETVNEEQQVGAVNIDSVVLAPKYVRPGDEVYGRVRLRDTWPAGQVPRVYFKADEQLYPATVSNDGSTYEGLWLAGGTNGSFPVNLLLEWPNYGRTETTLLGNYIIDGTAPLFELELQGTVLLGDMPAFQDRLVIKPRMLIRKPLDHWRLAFYTESGNLVGDMDGTGNLPEGFTWFARDNFGSIDNGDYEIVVTAWDRAGNLAEVSKWVRLIRNLPQVKLAVDRKADGMVVDLEHEGTVPLEFWRMEMWTKEGKILTSAEGNELPVKVDIKLETSEQDQEIRGVLVVKDILGNKINRKIEDLLSKKEKQAEAKAEEKKPTGVSESWVDEF